MGEFAQQRGTGALLEEHAGIGFDVDVGDLDAESAAQADEQGGEGHFVAAERAQGRDGILAFKRGFEGILLAAAAVGHIGRVVVVEVELGTLGRHAVAFLDRGGDETVGHTFTVVGSEDDAPAAAQVEGQLVVTLFDPGLAPEGGIHGPAHLLSPGLPDGRSVADSLAPDGHREGRRGDDLLPFVGSGPGELFPGIDGDDGLPVGRTDLIGFGLGQNGGQAGQQEEGEYPFHDLAL